MKRLLAFFYYPGSRPELVRIYKAGEPPRYGQRGPCHFHSFGLLVNWRAAWVGWHYGEHHKRLCINLLPCVTLWWAKPGGQLP